MTLSTHVLDTAHGIPATGVAITLSSGGQSLFSGLTDIDGRCPALNDLRLPRGQYRLSFDMGDYFRAKGCALPDPPFLDIIGIDFGLADDSHHHVPLLASPFSYSTYRGS